MMTLEFLWLVIDKAWNNPGISFPGLLYEPLLTVFSMPMDIKHKIVSFDFDQGIWMRNGHECQVF